MNICFCEECRYLFSSALLPGNCPDCGAKKVRYASHKERHEYRHFQKIIKEEIRLGVIPG